MIERDYKISFVANLALREKQIQQNYRPIIAVHKWFARRPGTLFRSLILSEFVDQPLETAYYSGHKLDGLHIADPFMGGGTPLLEANRLGCKITGYDINPMAYWVVKEEIEHLDLEAYKQDAADLRDGLDSQIGSLYRTACTECGSSKAHVKYFLWVKVQPCVHCSTPVDLFPGYLVAQDRRHPRNVYCCSECGELVECKERDKPGDCPFCHAPLRIEGPARRSRFTCPSCGTANRFPNPKFGAPKHRMFAMEYYCPDCRDSHDGRYFKRPDKQDLNNYADAVRRLSKMHLRFVPNDAIPGGDETDRLHRWGYRLYSELFNARQLLGLEMSARMIAACSNERVRNALATNLSDLLRYQNMLCRYDTMALKSLDIFSVHGFPVGLVQCESNLLGIVNPARKSSVGSGGWSNIIDKFTKAKEYCDAPFEIRHNGHRKVAVPIEIEWIGDVRNGTQDAGQREVNLNCGDAGKAHVSKNSLDAIFTDPPYFGNVQYAELIDFCYVWLRKLAQNASGAFDVPTTRNAGELTGNNNMGRSLEHFADGLSKVYQRMGKGLKPGSPFVFTYHHNNLEAYYAIAVAILDSGLTCSAVLPCPAEMGASIHISGTGSSILDSVFVCRTTGTVPRHWITSHPEEIAGLVQEDIAHLAPSHQATRGDIRCIAFGHLTRLAVWHLRSDWNRKSPINSRLANIASWIQRVGGAEAIEHHLSAARVGAKFNLGPLFAEEHSQYGEEKDIVSF